MSTRTIIPAQVVSVSFFPVSGDPYRPISDFDAHRICSRSLAIWTTRLKMQMEQC
jgi:hypothetical protein